MVDTNVLKSNHTHTQKHTSTYIQTRYSFDMFFICYINHIRPNKIKFIDLIYLQKTRGFLYTFSCMCILRDILCPHRNVMSLRASKIFLSNCIGVGGDGAPADSLALCLADCDPSAHSCFKCHRGRLSFQPFRDL